MSSRRRSGPTIRAIVFWNSVWCCASPGKSGRNGFGRSGVDSGYSRVPPPPAMITAYTRLILGTAHGRIQANSSCAPAGQAETENR